MIARRFDENWCESEDAMTAYIALRRKDIDSDFGVEFPDFPGCVTAGATLEEARQMADEALRLHVERMIEDQRALPAPSRQPRTGRNFWRTPQGRRWHFCSTGICSP